MVTLHDGGDGNNTVSAFGDTAASAGKSLTYDAVGVDSFNGGSRTTRSMPAPG